MNSIIDKDLNHILGSTKNIWSEIRDKTFFLTGGTGFFGIWLQLSFIHINKELGLNNRLLILTRNKKRFFEKYTYLQNSQNVIFFEGDITSFSFPEEKIDFLIHAATEASDKLNSDSPMEMFETVVNGTKRVLELARVKNVDSFLFTSSGAVYGQQPSDITHMYETYAGSPSISYSSMYAEGKRMAEVMCAVYHKHHMVPAKVARCYAFVGPHLPLNKHFAVGNFISNFLKQENIVVNGDGTALRSYLYASDLVIWLWTILFKGKPSYPYNVGSDIEVSIAELAEMIADNDAVNRREVEIRVKEKPKQTLRYVPSIKRAKQELGLLVKIDLSSAVRNTILFYSDQMELNEGNLKPNKTITGD